MKAPIYRTGLSGVILSGGASSRMGVDKALLELKGERSIDIVADLALRVGCNSVLVSGPQGYGYQFVPDARKHGGPVGGVMAAIDSLGPAAVRLLVLAVDAPLLKPDDLHPLIEYSGRGAAFSGFPLPFVADASAFPKSASPDWPLWRLLTEWGLGRIKPSQGVESRLRGANDVDEWRELSRLD